MTAVDGTGFTWTAPGTGLLSTGDHRAQETADGRTSATLTRTLSGPLSRIIAFFYGGLIRKYVRMEAEGLGHEAQRWAAGV